MGSQLLIRCDLPGDTSAPHPSVLTTRHLMRTCKTVQNPSLASNNASSTDTHHHSPQHDCMNVTMSIEQTIAPRPTAAGRGPGLACVSAQACLG